MECCAKREAIAAKQKVVLVHFVGKIRYIQFCLEGGIFNHMESSLVCKTQQLLSNIKSNTCKKSPEMLLTRTFYHVSNEHCFFLEGGHMAGLSDIFTGLLDER